MFPNPKRIFPVLLVLVLAGVGFWYFSARRTAGVAGDGLAASGAIEATRIKISAELGGQVAEVLVTEGDTVAPGDVLVRFDQELLHAHLAGARAALHTAEANYALIAAGLPAEQRRAAVASAELELVSARQARTGLDDKAQIAAAAAWQAFAAAEKALDQASDQLETILGVADPADVDGAQAAVVLARDALEKAREDFAPYERKAEDNLTRAVLQARLAVAQKAYDSVVTRYNNITGTANSFDLELAKSNFALAQAQVEDAARNYAQVKDSPDPDAVALADARLARAEASLAAAQAGPGPRQLAVARAQVETAEAAVLLVETQLSQAVVTAPSAGVILTRTVEPGEVVAAGSALLVLARLDDLTITVYVPEDRYGSIRLGQSAEVRVDSFPLDVFTGSVTNIADQAEFTPRNVQTAEGRRTTVYAVRLAVQDPRGLLKPGMPADVAFSR